jgi:dTDP-4-dehydrorhamnose 3,5-epimerase
MSHDHDAMRGEPPMFSLTDHRAARGAQTLDIQNLPIDGVMHLTPRRFADSRGYFVETYNRKTIAAAGITATFVQDNQSLSARRGTIRGLHFQLAPEPQAKLVRVMAGSVYDVAVDLRAGSPSYGRWCSATLTAAAGEQLFIPAGFAHGFCTLEDHTMVAYKVDGFYAKACESGLRWDDPDLAIDWPVTAAEVQVSDKDAVLPLLRDATTPFVF